MPATTADQKAERMFAEAVDFVRREYGEEAELKHPMLVRAYIAARAITTCQERETARQ